LIAGVVEARQMVREGEQAMHQAMLAFSDIIDQRGDEEMETEDTEGEREAP
jgi:hypothetical protein